MKDCPLGLECINLIPDYCINCDYCSHLCKALPLPYSYYFNQRLNCWVLSVDISKPQWNNYEENTLKDIKECGWADAILLFYERYFDLQENCWVLKVNSYTMCMSSFPFDWCLAEDLPYRYVWDENINKFYLYVNCSPYNPPGFESSRGLPYETYKDNWGCHVLEVTKSQGDFEPANPNLTFQTYLIKDGKYRTFLCHEVVFKRKNLGFQLALKLPYSRSKNRLTVTKNISRYGYQKAIPIKPKTHLGQILYTDANYHCIPQNFYFKTHLEKKKLKLAPNQEPKAYYRNPYHKIFALYDVNECK